MEDDKVTIELQLDLKVIHQLYGLAIAQDTTVDEVVENILKEFTDNYNNMEKHNKLKNINDSVEVKLTSYGEHILRKENKIAYEYDYNENTKVLQLELWSIMDTFGKYMLNTSEQVFQKNEIIVI